jgi:hypothetical protein
MIILFIVIGGTLVGTLILLEVVSYITLLEINPRKQGYLTPKEFKKMFDESNWERTNNESAEKYNFSTYFLGIYRAGSLWDYPGNNELHASIVKFNNKRYGLYYHTYVYAGWYIKKHYKNNVTETKTRVTMLGDIIRRIKGVN